MNKNNQAYHKLKEQFSIEELADAVMLPEELTASEEAQAHKTFADLRMQRKASMSDKEQLLSSLLHFKHKLRRYLEQNSEYFKFGELLIYYIKLIGRTQREFAEEIGLHSSRLNRIIKGKEKIGISIAYRLETHSGDIIPAILWWKVLQREIEEEILTEKKAREIERQFVKKVIYRA